MDNATAHTCSQRHAKDLYSARLLRAMRLSQLAKQRQHNNLTPVRGGEASMLQRAP
jgi:hypothetical protein